MLGYKVILILWAILMVIAVLEIVVFAALVLGGVVPFRGGLPGKWDILQAIAGIFAGITIGPLIYGSIPGASIMGLSAAIAWRPPEPKAGSIQEVQKHE
jgi:hypothetical protein